MSRFYRLAKRPDLIASGGGLFAAPKRRPYIMPANLKNGENKQGSSKSEEILKNNENNSDEMKKLPSHVLAVINGENVGKKRIRPDNQPLGKSDSKQEDESTSIETTKNTEDNELLEIF